MDWGILAYSTVTPSLQNVLDSHIDVFKDELGTVKDIKVSLTTKSISQPKFHRPRPLALKDAIDSQLHARPKECNYQLRHIRTTVWPTRSLFFCMGKTWTPVI